MRILLFLTLAVLALSCDSTTSVEPLSGIQGHVTMSPICPVVTDPPDPSCEPAPLKAMLEVRNPDGRTLARVTSGSDGQYKVAIGPGHYFLVSLPLSQAGSLPSPPSPVEVDVQAGSWVSVDLDYDTGIR